MTQEQTPHWSGQVGEADSTTFQQKSPLVMKEIERTAKAVIADASMFKDDGLTQYTARASTVDVERIKASSSGPWTVSMIGLALAHLDYLEREGKTLMIENRVKR